MIFGSGILYLLLLYTMYMAWNNTNRYVQIYFQKQVWKTYLYPPAAKKKDKDPENKDIGLDKIIFKKKS